MSQLSSRLATIADFVPRNAKICDVGTDHGYLAIELSKNGKAKTVIATDIAEKPLANAAKNIKKAGVENISLRLCNGLEAVKPEETDSVIIAGMGGEVISGILQKDSTVTARKGVLLILQPTTSPEVLRRFLYKNGYIIIKEKAVYENNKLYSVMFVEFTGKKVQKDEFFYYVGLLTPQDDNSLMYIKKQLNRVQKCMISLENIKEKRTDYIHYKSVFCGITEYLKSFDGEHKNGI